MPQVKSLASIVPPVAQTTTYSPDLRTAVVLVGTGTAGAYHAGVLRALREAGVKVDLLAGRGMGVASAMFSAIDGDGSLWHDSGVWRSPAVTRLYDWRGTLKVAMSTLAVALLALFVPLVALIGAAMVYPVAFFVGLLGVDAGARMAAWYAGLLDMLFHPSVLPLFLPRFVFVALLAFLGVLVSGEVVPRIRARWRRRARGIVWWRMVGAPLDVTHATSRFSSGLWKIMRGATRIAKPSAVDLAERYAELLSENVGQPGFRELVVTTHDLDARRDVVFSLLGEAFRPAFFARRLGHEGGDRHLELIDLAGPARRHAMDALAGALSLPIVTEPHPVRFSSGHPWRGETHHLVDRPAATSRLLEEVLNAGAEQVIFVSALPESRGPHEMEAARRDARGRAGDQLAAAETAATRDALLAWSGRFQAVFSIRPEHNPVGPFDFSGSYDERSDRFCRLGELVDRGRDDGYRQFVDPVVGASGEWIDPGPAGSRQRANSRLSTPTSAVGRS